MIHVMLCCLVHPFGQMRERSSAHQERTLVTDGASLWTLAWLCPDDAHL